MFYADYHNHSEFSNDSTTPMEDIVIQGINLGLKEIAITDHYDFDYPEQNYPLSFDYKPYSKKIDELREKYGHKIFIAKGVEVGIMPSAYSKILNLVNNNEFDFIIGSTHSVLDIELYDSNFFDGKDKKLAYTQYLEDVYDGVKNCCVYNVCGHLDFVSRYGPYEDSSLLYADYADLIDLILKGLIEKGSGIELNTSGYKYGINGTYPQYEIVKRYKELGGEIITVGSDAHEPKYMTDGFKPTYEMLKKIGFNHITTFKNRKPTFIKI